MFVEYSESPYEDAEEDSIVTVCVAAIAGGLVLGASDRMLTSGDIEFEPEATKIWPVTNSIVMMVAGDFGLQAEINGELDAEVSRRIQAAPDQWVRVEDVATLYADSYSRARNRRAERDLLAPLGLSYDSFLARQRELSPDLVQQLARDLIQFEMPAVSAIVAGVDTFPRGLATPHIWKVSGNRVTCADAAGFAAIGAGYWHAQSQFMSVGYTRDSDVSSASFTVLSAKKRAEVAPGVGLGTDMFSVGSNPGSYARLPVELVANLEGIYSEGRLAEEAAFASARQKTGEYFQRLLDAVAQVRERQESSPPPASPDDESAAEEEAGTGGGG